MPSSFNFPILIKPTSAPPLLTPSTILSIISLPSRSTINLVDYTTFDDSEELSELEKVLLEQLLFSFPITLLLQSNQSPPIALCTRHITLPPLFSALEI